MHNKTIFSRIFETPEAHAYKKHGGTLIIGCKPKEGFGKRMLVDGVKNPCLTQQELGGVVVENLCVVGDVAKGCNVDYGLSLVHSGTAQSIA